MTHTLSNIIDLTNAPTPPRWFEFVFEPDRLEHHLGQGSLELITSFYRNMPDLETSPKGTNPLINNTQASPTNGFSTSNGVNDNGEPNELCDVIIPPGSYEAKYRLRKTYALQTLAIKVASHLIWDLDALCDGLTIPIQCKLFQALKSACQPEKCPPDMKKFASIIYCRWFLRSALAYKLSTLQPQNNSTTIIYLSQLQQQQQTADTISFMSMGELFSETSKELRECTEELHSFITDSIQTKDQRVKKLKTTNHPFKKIKLSRPKVNCFNSRDEELNDWNENELVESLEFIEAACYDLGRFYFFEESYSKSRDIFDIIKSSRERFPLLESFLKSCIDILAEEKEGTARNDASDPINSQDEGTSISEPDDYCDKLTIENNQQRLRTEKYLFDCMGQFSNTQAEKSAGDSNCNDDPLTNFEEDSDMRIDTHGISHQRLPENSAWYLQVPTDQHQQQLLEMGKGDVFMSRGNFKQAMGCFVGALMLMTNYFRVFSKNYTDEEPYITRMIQCSISLSCYTQAVALCQMTKNLNYTVAFKQLNERICNDCCDDIYECIWNVTLLEYIINLHAKRGEVDRRTKVIQLIGQLELNENNPDEFLKEAEHVRRGRFFRIMSNKYL